MDNFVVSKFEQKANVPCGRTLVSTIADTTPSQYEKTKVPKSVIVFGTVIVSKRSQLEKA